MAIYSYCNRCRERGEKCQSPDLHRSERAYVWKIYVRPGGRKGIQIKETRLTKEAAKAREREIFVLYEKGELFKDKEKAPRTFGEACDHYTTSYLLPNKQNGELYAVKLFKEELGINRQLENITKEDLTALYQTLRGRMAMASVIRRWVTLQGIFRENSAYIKENPALGIIPKMDRKRADRKKTIYFTDDQYRKLLSVLKREEEKDIVIIFRHTGFRKGDGKALMFEHCDFNMRTIHLLNSKNGEQSSVPMIPLVYERLRAIQKRLGRTTGPVFNMSNTSRWMRQRLKEAGLYKPYPDNLSLHSLRHSFGTYIQRTYKDLKVTQELLRHKTVAMTLRYAHAADEAKRAAAMAASVSPAEDIKEKSVISEAKNEAYGVIPTLYREKSENENS